MRSCYIERNYARWILEMVCTSSKDRLKSIIHCCYLITSTLWDCFVIAGTEKTDAASASLPHLALSSADRLLSKIYEFLFWLWLNVAQMTNWTMVAFPSNLPRMFELFSNDYAQISWEIWSRLSRYISWEGCQSSNAYKRVDKYTELEILSSRNWIAICFICRIYSYNRCVQNMLDSAVSRSILWVSPQKVHNIEFRC